MLFHSGLLELLSSLGLVSKIVLLILLIFSIGSWTVILYKWRFFRRQEAANFGSSINAANLSVTGAASPCSTKSSCVC